MTGEPGAVAARSPHPDPADPTPRLHPGDQLRIGGGIRPELIGSQQAARAIHHRPNVEIPMCVHPANHTYPIGPNLLCHVLAFRRLPRIQPPEPGRAADRTLKVEKSKLLSSHPAPRFRVPSRGQVDRSWERHQRPVFA